MGILCTISLALYHVAKSLLICVDPADTCFVFCPDTVMSSAEDHDAQELDPNEVEETYDNHDQDLEMSDSDSDASRDSKSLDGEVDQSDNGDSLHEDFIDESVQGFFDHKDSIYCIAVSPRNKDLCVSGGGDELAFLWSISSGECLSILNGHTDSITTVKFSSDGLLIATAGMDGIIRAWRVNDTGKPECEFLTTLEAGSEVLWMEFHPTGYALIAGTADGTVWMWNLPRGHVMNVFAGHTAASTSGCWAADGKNFASVSEDGTIILWEPVSGMPHKRWETAQDERLSGGAMGWNVIALDMAGKICTVGSPDGKAKVINMMTGALLASLETQTDSIEAISYAKTLPLLAIASIDGTIALYEVPSLRLRTVLRHDDAVVGLHFEPGTPMLFSCSTDRTVRRWDVRTSQEERCWRGHQDAILCMAVQAGGRKVITAGDDKTALVFDS